MCLLKSKQTNHLEYPSQSIALHTCSLPTTANLPNEELLATHGKTFYFASRFLPLELRHPVIILYAFFRTLDDLVDEPTPGRVSADVRAELEAWKSWLSKNGSFPAPREALGRSLHAVLEEHPIPTTIFLDFLNGLISDLGPCEIRNFSEMHHYCYRVAGTVGLAMAHMLGVRSPTALMAAQNLGIAMQLTNILRDIGSDLAADRVYLPRDELERFDYSRMDLLKLSQKQQQPDQRFLALMRYQVQRARYYYATSMHGIWLLPPDCRLPILIAGRLYQRILTVIEHNHYDVFRARAATNLTEKVYEATIAFILDRLWRSKEAWTNSEMEALLGDEISFPDTHHSTNYPEHTSI